MPSAPRSPLRGPACEKNDRIGRQCRSIDRKLSVLERDIADRRDLVNAANPVRPDSKPLAVPPVRRNCFKLMTKDLQREPLERFRLWPVDKREDLLVDGHRLFAKEGWTATIMAPRRAPIQSCRSPKAPFWRVNCSIYLAPKLF